MTSISYAAVQIGYDEKGEPGASYTKHRRDAQIQQHELRALKRQCKGVMEDQKDPLAQLKSFLWKKLITA